MDLVKEFTKLPTGGPGVPSLPDNTVQFYRDNSWKSSHYEVKLTQYEKGVRHRLPSSWNDTATWVAFRLPVGRVVTLTQHEKPDFPNGNIANLSGCGDCIDLIGTGQLESVSLYAVGLNDTVTGFFWRDVDLRAGAIELFRHEDFQGTRTVIFLSDWRPGATQSLHGWWLHDKISSVRWKSIVDRQTAKLFANTDGKGERQHLNSWSSEKEIRNLGNFGLNDKISAFEWDALVPEKEHIEPFVVDDPINASAPDDFVSIVHEGKNETDKEQTKSFAFERDIEKTLTVSTSDTHVMGIKTSWSPEISAGVDGIGTAKVTWTVELTYQYSQTVTTGSSESKSLHVPVTDDMVVMPHHAWRWSAQVFIGWLPRKRYTTQAYRWYKEQLSGSQPDGDLWKRKEDIYVEVEGCVAAHVLYDHKQTPLPTQ